MRLHPSDHYRQLHAEIWDGEDEQADEIDGMQPHPVVAGIEALGSVHTKLGDTMRGLGEGHAQNAEMLKEALADVMGVVVRSHADMTKAVSDGEGRTQKAMTEMQVVVGEMKAAMEKDSSTTRTTVLSLTRVITDLTQRMDALAAAMTAPRRLITDSDGRPVGVEIGD